MAEYRKRRSTRTTARTSSRQQRIMQELEEIKTRLQSLDDIKMELSQIKEIVEKRNRRKRRRLVFPLRRPPVTHTQSAINGLEERKRHPGPQNRAPDTGGGIPALPFNPNNIDMGKVTKLLGDPAFRNLLKGMMK